MNKKKIHKLLTDGSNPYRLLGISSHENDYRLSWAANRKLGLNLRKSDSIFMKKAGKENLEFSVFTEEDNSYKMNLISNRCPNGFLINELKNIDFFLQVFGDIPRGYIDEITSGLKSVDIVSAIFEIQGKPKKTWNLPPE